MIQHDYTHLQAVTIIKSVEPLTTLLKQLTHHVYLLSSKPKKKKHLLVPGKK